MAERQKALLPITARSLLGNLAQQQKKRTNLRVWCRTGRSSSRFGETPSVFGWTSWEPRSRQPPRAPSPRSGSPLPWPAAGLHPQQPSNTRVCLASYFVWSEPSALMPRRSLARDFPLFKPLSKYKIKSSKGSDPWATWVEPLPSHNGSSRVHHRSTAALKGASLSGSYTKLDAVVKGSSRSSFKIKAETYSFSFQTLLHRPC